MTNYYRVTTPVEGADGKTRFRAIGVAFPVSINAAVNQAAPFASVSAVLASIMS